MKYNYHPLISILRYSSYLHGNKCNRPGLIWVRGKKDSSASNKCHSTRYYSYQTITFKVPPSLYCFQNVPSRLELMVNFFTHLSWVEWPWIAIVWVTVISFRSSCRNCIFFGSSLLPHHEDSADTLFSPRFPCHGAKSEPLYVKTSGFLAFAVTFGESINLEQTRIEERVKIMHLMRTGLWSHVSASK